MSRSIVFGNRRYNRHLGKDANTTGTVLGALNQIGSHIRLLDRRSDTVRLSQFHDHVCSIGLFADHTVKAKVNAMRHARCLVTLTLTSRRTPRVRLAAPAGPLHGAIACGGAGAYFEASASGFGLAPIGNTLGN